MRRALAVLVLALAALAACGTDPAPEPAAPARAADLARGRALYQTYCIACHDEKVHWRDRSLVHSWADLRDQVTRFERIAGQEWSDEEIDDVAAYLNGQFYRLRCPVPGCGGPSG
jgi:mono/diheme cytochrome c family protein